MWFWIRAFLQDPWKKNGFSMSLAFRDIKHDGLEKKIIMKGSLDKIWVLVQFNLIESNSFLTWIIKHMIYTSSIFYYINLELNDGNIHVFYEYRWIIGYSKFSKVRYVSQEKDQNINFESVGAAARGPRILWLDCSYILKRMGWGGVVEISVCLDFGAETKDEPEIFEH